MPDDLLVNAARWYWRQADAASRDFTANTKWFVIINWALLGGVGALVGAIATKITDDHPASGAGLGFVAGLIAGSVLTYVIAITLWAKRRRVNRR